ncbi:MAG: type II toxin-antitoxin system prevent-host-death family antitoxin [Candidatus Shapirobacteria bacterium]|nr:type II toxin-antitoxin system prevent-host-death family antitoxin [Candidatus Shapirobacteria bacterium]
MNITSYTASDARQNLYSLIKKASKGLTAIEINLRNSEPVVMINKAEMESWLETLDIMSSLEEVKAIRRGLKSKKSISLDKLEKELGL